MNIDMHHHFVPEQLLDFIDKNPSETRAQLLSDRGEVKVHFDNGGVIPVYRGQYDNKIRHHDMEKMGLDAAVLSVAPIFFFYWLDRAVTNETCRICNDWAAQVSREDSTLFAMGTLPMQDVDLSLLELKRAHETLGINAFEISPIIEGNQLDSDRFNPI